MKVSKSLSALLALATTTAALAPVPGFAQEPAFTVVAQHLEAPRGLRFGPDGNLYVAEAGLGGSHGTVGQCQQVPGPVGPYKGGSSGRISRINLHNSTVTTVASGFPSTQDAMGDLIGVADVAFLNGSLYALIAGGGCSHGNPTSPSGIAKVDLSTGKWSLLADIGAWLKAHPAKYESADDFEPDGTLYSLVSRYGVLYTVEPNHGQVIEVTTRGRISQVIDISAAEGHIVPTSLAIREDVFYVGNLNLFPIDPQWARILTITLPNPVELVNIAPGLNPEAGYRVTSSKAGFTTVVGVDFGPDGLLYALELSDGAGFPTPTLGKVVRINHAGALEEVITGLNVPAGMTFGPDGRLYVSDFGAVPAPGFSLGRILRFDIPPGY